MLEYILKLHTSSQARQTQGGERSGLLGHAVDWLGKGAHHCLFYYLWDLLLQHWIPARFLALSFMAWKTPVPLHVTLAVFSLKKQGRKRGWLDMKKENTPSGQDDCKKKGNYWLISCILSCFTGPPTLNLSTSFFPKSAPCTLAKLHYRLGQNTNAILTEKTTKGQNIGSNSRCNFFCNSLFPKDREKSPSKYSEFSSQDLVFQGCKMYIPLYNTSKKN